MKSNRTRVIETASNLILERGVAQTSMDEVVSHSGVAKSNIYYHFKTKDELLLAVLMDYMKRVEPAFRRILLEGSEPLPERLRMYTDNLIEELAERDCVGGCPLLSLVVEAGRFNPLLREHLMPFFQREQEYLTLLLRAGQAAQEVRGDLAAEALAALLVAWIEGTLMVASIRRETTTMRMERDALLHLLKA